MITAVYTHALTDLSIYRTILINKLLDIILEYN